MIRRRKNFGDWGEGFPGLFQDDADPDEESSFEGFVELVVGKEKWGDINVAFNDKRSWGFFV